MHQLSVHLLYICIFHLIIPIKSANFDMCNAREASCILEGFGYPASCVLNALSTCESKPTQSSMEKSLEDLTNTFKSYVKTRRIQSEKPQNCAEVDDKSSAIKRIYPFPTQPRRSIKVYCDQVTDGGGWTVFQRRKVLPDREDFFRNWVEYALGFGEASGEYWLGLDAIHALTSNVLMEMRIDLEDWDGERRYARYQSFAIGGPDTDYTLHVGKYSGNAGDSLDSHLEQYNHNGLKFSTYDRDNDGKNSTVTCAEGDKGGWWYNACHISNLNGLPHRGKYATGHADGISWHYWRGTYYSLKESTMMIRPLFSSRR